MTTVFVFVDRIIKVINIVQMGIKKVQDNLYSNCKVSYTKIMVVKQKIELPLDCRYIFVNYNNYHRPFRSTKEVLHFIEGNRLEIVNQQTFNQSYVVVVKKADSFL